MKLSTINEFIKSIINDLFKSDYELEQEIQQDRIKMFMWSQIVKLIDQKNIHTDLISDALNLDCKNVKQFIVHGNHKKLSVKDINRILKYLEAAE